MIHGFIETYPIALYLIVTGIIYFIAKASVSTTNSERYENWANGNIFFEFIVPGICYGIFYVSGIAFFIIPILAVLGLILVLFTGSYQDNHGGHPGGHGLDGHGHGQHHHH